jgi:heme/copper-type cytochrome/quinol oxidase subunit 2
VNARRKSKFAITLAIFLPVKMFACAACYGGNIDSPMADGMNWGIFTLLAVIGTVLLTLLTFFIHIIRKSEALAAAANQAPPQSPQV